MKKRILNVMENSKNENMFNTSVIFENKLTGEIKFYNGVSEKFEFITKSVFDELKNEKSIELEKCICQGDNRYILAQ